MTLTWGIIFDKAGNMYAASNGPTGVGGLARSTNKGVTWAPLMSGIDLTAGCPSFRGFGIAPDGTVFTMNQACQSEGKTNYAYYLDNVGGTGTNWTKATTTVPIGYAGIEIGCAVAGNGSTIICPTGTGKVLLSNDNARSWAPAASGPTGTQELLDAVTVGSVSYVTGAVLSPTISGAWFSLDNGSTWQPLGMPPGIITAGDAWAATMAGAGPNNGHMMYYQGESVGSTGFWCWNGTPPSGSWVFCGNNQDAGQTRIDVTSVVTNRTQNRTIAVKYEDAGLKPIYSDDGSNWADASSGLTCTSLGTPDCGRDGGPKTAHVAMDPTTGVFYISMKPGDIWATTTTQDH